MYIPFTQTLLWADINKYYNNMLPLEIRLGDIFCLFGVNENERSMTSFNGPVLSQYSNIEDIRLFLKEILLQAKLNKINFINIRALHPLRYDNPFLENEIMREGFRAEKWHTLIIDLSLTEDELLKSFSHASRKAIKKANILGAKIELCDSFEKYYNEFLVPYCSVTGKEIKTKNFCQQGWSLDRSKIYRYWVAKSKEGEPLGFLGTYTYDHVATEIMSALTPFAMENKIPAQDLLHWEVIKYHKDIGDKFFDLAGFNPNPTTDKERGIKRFKEKWGGKVYDCSSYYLDTRSMLDKIVGKIKRAINV